MKFGYTIIYVPDVPATLAFYEKAFDMKRRFLHDTGLYGELDTGTTALAFANEEFVQNTYHNFTPIRPTSPPPGVEIGFVAANVHKSYAKAVAAGAKPEAKPFAKPWGQIVSYVRDLNGFLVEICSEVFVSNEE